MEQYVLDNAWDRARRRLSLLEHHLDPMSRRRLLALGLTSGWHCLEVGGGGGSMARWLCGQVVASGQVTATDIDTRFLEEIDEPNIQVLRHDITSEELPAGRFDVVHVRWLLHHLPNPEQVIASLVSALRPGGWLLLEDVDFFPIHTSTSRLYIDFMEALASTVTASSGRGCFWARALPSMVAEQGLVEVGGEGDIPVLQGGSSLAAFFQLSAEQMRDRIQARGAMSAADWTAAIALLDDPKFLAFAGAGIAVWGQRPHDTRE
jgi:SAM-dependent methyltransferase